MGEYDAACEYIQKAITICETKGVKKSLDIFYADYGYVLCLQKKYEQAEHYFALSTEIYDLFGTYWLRSIVENYMAVISAKQGKKEKALSYLRKAEIYFKKEMTKEELVVRGYTRKILQETGVI